MSFPSNPSNGQTANVNGITYEYTTSNNTWTRLLTNPNVFIANSIFSNTTIVSGGNTRVNGLTVNTSVVATTTLQAKGGIQNTPIGNVTPSTAIFTSESVSGNSTVNAITVNNSATVGTTLRVTGNTIVGNLSTSGNISGSYLFGNGSQLTGIDATSIQNGTSNVKVYLNGPVTISSAGTANILTVSDTAVTSTRTLTGTTVEAAQIGNTGSLLTGTLTTAAQPNVTSVSDSLTIGEITIASNAITSTSDIITIEPAGAGGTGSVIIEGNLRVTGNVFAIDSQIVTINDKNILLANNQSTSVGTDGAGLWAGNIAGTPIATFVYNNATTSWQSNVGITPESNASLSLGGTNNYWSTGYFNSLQAPTVTAGNVSGETFTATNSFNGALNGNLGSAGGNAAIVSTLSATGNATVNALTVNNSATVDGTLGISGNITGAAGKRFTGLDSITANVFSGAFNGSLNGPVGSAGGNTAIFSSTSTTGNATVQQLTVNGTATIGATLGVAGGLQNTPIGNAVTNSGSFTQLNAATFGNTGATFNGETYTGTSFTATSGFNGALNGSLGTGGGNTAVVSSLSATGIATVSSLVSNSTVTAATSLTSGSLITGDINSNANVTANALTVNNSVTINAGLGVTGTVTIAGNILPSANATYNLGSATQRWNTLYVAANTIDIGGTTLSAPQGILVVNNGISATDATFTTVSAATIGNAGAALIGQTLNTSSNATVNAITINNSATIGTTLGVVGNIVAGNYFYANGLQAVGPQGPQGPQGIQGPQGPQGPQGIQGPQGPIGNTGPQGPQGPIGPIGNTGPQGPQGPIGNTGPQGPQGPIGPIGNTGPQGPQGPIGNTGPQGPQGPIGNTGPQGPQGIQGPQGPQGVQGPTGPSTIVNATNNNTTTVLYPVMVGAAGSDQTPNVSTSKFTFNASSGALTATGGIQNTPIGNATASTGQFTTVSVTGNITGGNVTSNGQVILSDGNATSPSLVWRKGATDTGFYASLNTIIFDDQGS